MSIITYTLMGIALSMDALSVSVLNGMLIKELKIKHALGIAATFGFFQGIMPVLGWLSGLSFRRYTDAYSHWIAFALLFLVGIKMIHDSCSSDNSKTCKTCLEMRTLITMSLATSIDAFAVGVTYSILNIDIILPVCIIGFVTFIMCLTGIIASNRLFSFCEKKTERIGGVVLIFLGLKTVIEHYFPF